MNYKARIIQRLNDIPYQKGTAGWLRKYISIIWANGSSGLEVAHITPEMAFKIKYDARQLTKVRESHTGDKALIAFYRDNDFDVGLCGIEKIYFIRTIDWQRKQGIKRGR